ncbi:MAG: hypothetical protein ACFB10_18500 [Salibacteraceae bacterium]
MPVPRYATREFHRFYLKITAFVVGSLGPIFALGSYSPTAEPARFTLDLVAWNFSSFHALDAPTARFLSALIGGILMGWGMLIWFLATKVHAKAPEEVRQAVVGSICVWFVFDSGGSIASGNAFNAMSNTLIMLIGMGPLWWPARG